jgi:alkylhydroperoxidase family enzyme
MARIEPVEHEAADPRARVEWARQVEAHGRMTNLKRTLARSPLALEIYMQWYPLRDAVRAFLGERLTTIFSHAISAETDCLVCSTYFRRHLIEAGEDPDDLFLDPKEADIAELGRQVSRDPRRIDDTLFDRMRRHLRDDDLVTLVAFAGQMVATNLVVHALQVDLDPYLESYRK